MPDHAATLRAALTSRDAVIGIIGLGYVGLPLARAVHDAGFRVIGFDVDPAKIDALRAGRSYIQHLGDEVAQSFARSGRFVGTGDADRLAEADVILLCVPTPLGVHREPDLQFVINSTRLVAEILRPGQLIVLESTTYPGTTRQEMKPLLDGRGLKCGEDYFLAYSPEREDPGRTDQTTRTIPRIVGGIDPASGALAADFYREFVDRVHEVASAEVAEASKLLENIFRAVNIALVNELKVILEAMGIDIWEVIAASSTKPFGFMPFYPGPGLGGHCIPIDPFYLAWRAREVGQATKFIELAGEINQRMPGYVIERLTGALNDAGKSLRGARVLIIGISYKPNIDDIRESPAAAIIEGLERAGAAVAYHDPHMPRFPRMRKHEIELESVPLTESAVRGCDAVIIVTDHDAVDYGLLGRAASLIVDTRNAMAAVDAPVARIVKA